MVLGTTTYPLLPVRGRPADNFSAWKGLALDTATDVPPATWVERDAAGRYGVVAIVIPEDATIHFATITQTSNGARHLDGLTRFAPPLPVPDLSRRTASASTTESAMFTD